MSDQDVRELVARVGKLERDNRRLKLAGAGVVAVLLTVALVGAVMPQEIPDVIEAREFRVVAENGNTRAELGAGWLILGERSDHRMEFFSYGFSLSQRGLQLPRIAADLNGIGFWDSNGTSRGGICGRRESVVSHPTTRRRCSP